MGGFKIILSPVLRGGSGSGFGEAGGISELLGKNCVKSRLSGEGVVEACAILLEGRCTGGRDM
jgi:hypothetical protein